MAWKPPFKKDRHLGNSSCVRQIARTYGISFTRLAELDNREPKDFTAWLYDDAGMSARDAARLTSLLEQEKRSLHEQKHHGSGL